MSHHLHKVKAFSLTVEDRPGSLARVTSDLKGCGVNLQALWAWGEDEGLATVMFIPEDASVVEGCGCETCSGIEEEMVLWLEQEDVRGALDEFLQPIQEAGINLAAVQVIALEGKFGAVVQFDSDEDLESACEMGGGSCCGCS